MLYKGLPTLTRAAIFPPMLAHWSGEQPAVALGSGLAMPPAAPLLMEWRP